MNQKTNKSSQQKVDAYLSSAVKIYNMNSLDAPIKYKELASKLHLIFCLVEKANELIFNQVEYKTKLDVFFADMSVEVQKCLFILSKQIQQNRFASGLRLIRHLYEIIIQVIFLLRNPSAFDGFESKFITNYKNIQVGFLEYLQNFNKPENIANIDLINADFYDWTADVIRLEKVKLHDLVKFLKLEDFSFIYNVSSNFTKMNLMEIELDSIRNKNPSMKVSGDSNLSESIYIHITEKLLLLLEEFYNAQTSYFNSPASISKDVKIVRELLYQQWAFDDPGLQPQREHKLMDNSVFTEYLSMEKNQEFVFNHYKNNSFVLEQKEGERHYMAKRMLFNFYTLFNDFVSSALGLNKLDPYKSSLLISCVERYNEVFKSFISGATHISLASIKICIEYCLSSLFMLENPMNVHLGKDLFEELNLCDDNLMIDLQKYSELRNCATKRDERAVHQKYKKKNIKLHKWADGISFRDMFSVIEKMEYFVPTYQFSLHFAHATPFSVFAPVFNFEKNTFPSEGQVFIVMKDVIMILINTIGRLCQGYDFNNGIRKLFMMTIESYRRI